MPKLVAGVDESVGAAAALRWGLREANTRGWSVTALLAWGLLDQHPAPSPSDFDPSYNEDDALAALDTIVRDAVGHFEADNVQRLAVSDLPARALVEAARDAELVVVGARGLGALKGWLLGSVSQAVLHQAAVPVAVIREDWDQPARPPENRIVVGVDGSDTAARALEWALDAARSHHAPLEVIHAWALPAALLEPLRTSSVDFDVLAKAAGHTLDTAVDCANTHDVDVTRTVAAGAPTTSLLDAAAHADLLVIGSRGMGGFKGLLLGSVSQQLAQHAPCPLVVVPPVSRV